MKEWHRPFPLDEEFILMTFGFNLASRRHRIGLFGLLALSVVSIALLRRIGESEEATMASNFNVPTPTLGGTQFWTDHHIQSGHRIQQHAITRHWRWLDERRIRRAWGSRVDVEEAFAKGVPQAEPPQHVIVLLHGLMRTSHSMESLQAELSSIIDAEVVRFGYSSTRQTLAESAEALRDVLDHYPSSTRFSFIGHSMGNIIVRRCVGDLERDPDGQSLLSRCNAMVMLGPPNQGAAIARRMSKTGVFGWVAGPAAMELGPNWDEIVETLAIPPFPFAIVAGDRTDAALQNPLVDGPSDFVVSVDEARLDGATEVQRVDVLHSFLMDDADIRSWTVSWLLEHGCQRRGSGT
ncbi:MAG: alpha/beta hydrolase [Planctomycetota bacterium]